jgi:Mg2+/Co2+ transporter CorC
LFSSSCYSVFLPLPSLSLSLSLSLYRETLNEIMTKGHSRVPVYAGNSKNVVGLILVISFLSVSVIQLIFFWVS